MDSNDSLRLQLKRPVSRERLGNGLEARRKILCTRVRKDPASVPHVRDHVGPKPRPGTSGWRRPPSSVVLSNFLSHAIGFLFSKDHSIGSSLGCSYASRARRRASATSTSSSLDKCASSSSSSSTFSSSSPCTSRSHPRTMRVAKACVSCASSTSASRFDTFSSRTHPSSRADTRRTNPYLSRSSARRS